MRATLLVLILLVALVIALSAALGSSGEPRFTGKVTGAVPYSDSVLGVAFQVENVGTAAGAPSCTVTAAASVKEGGVNGVVLPSIKPHQYDYVAATNDRVTVSGNAARAVDVYNGGAIVKCS